MRSKLLAAIACSAFFGAAYGQSCPIEIPSGEPEESVSRTLSGAMVYHDEIRKWFELVLDSPTCGQSQVQVLQGGGSFEVDEANARTIETFRGCHVTIDGSLGIPGTGYYSAAMYLNAAKITPAKDCILQAPFPDYSKAKPDRSNRAYRVSMKLDYTEQGTISITARSGKRLLEPWQAYTSYTLTGLFSFYGHCAEGYDMSRLSGTPEAKPWVIDNYAAMDPERASAKHIRYVTMEFTCRRGPRAASHHPNQ